jgi:hypothetical protein
MEEKGRRGGPPLGGVRGGPSTQRRDCSPPPSQAPAGQRLLAPARGEGAAAPPLSSSSAAPGQLEVELRPSPASPLGGGPPHLPCFRLRAGPLLRTLVEPGAGRSARPGCALHLANPGSVRDVP